MIGDSKDNLISLAVELEDHAYRHFENHLMLWAVRDSQKSMTKAFSKNLSRGYALTLCAIDITSS